MNGHFVVSPYPTLLEDMVAKVYEAQAPLAEVDSITIPERDGTGTPTPGAGHQVQYELSFTGLDAITHIMRLYTDGGTLLQEFVFNPSENVVTLYAPDSFTIGDGGPTTPAVGTDTYTNIDFAGATAAQLRVYREGVLFKDFTVDPGGGFQLSALGDVFAIGERWHIERVPSVVSNPVNDSVVAKIYGGFVSVANTTRSYTAADLRKLILLSGNSGAYTFGVSAQVPIGYDHTFSNQVGGTATINFNNGSLITPSGTATTYSLGSGQIASFTWDGTNWHLVSKYGETAANHVIAARGSATVGEISFNKSVTVTIGSDMGTTNYTVLGCLRSVNSANAANDCTAIWTLTSKANTSFVIHVREESPVNQSLAFDWVIIKNT